MTNLNRINIITGWIVFLVALVVYTLTLEPTSSFWDTGEFIAGAYKLQVVHPPGAPFFLLIGRIFTMFAPTAEHVAWTVNFMSGLSSAFVVLFIFWIITHFAKKIIIPSDEFLTTDRVIAVMGAGVVGALAATFSDTFWFSAVEGEVYALSTFFMFFVFWCIVKWDAIADEPYADRYIVLIGLLMGISIGVHLMSLLAIPAMALAYYFRRYHPSPKGIIIALAVGGAVLGLIYVGIVSIFPNMLAKTDIFFRNSLGLPFNTGIIFLLVLLVLGLIYGIYYSHRANKPVLNMAMMTLTMIFIGYTTYFVVAIRANANPPINMNNPDNMVSLNSYLNREQYGDRPLLFGPHFNAYPINIENKGDRYAKGDEQYDIIGKNIDYVFDDKDIMFFPRLGFWQEDRHAVAYRAQLGLSPEQNPTFADNIRFFISNHLNYMYFRYFMWNFSGRQNDKQGIKHANNDGNWITGLNFIDKSKIGDYEYLPDEEKNNLSRNRYFLLPFILGIVGLVFHYMRHRQDFWVVMLLFVFTGLMEIIYFNQPPFEPRERDYAVVGSFLTFTIWIGLGLLAIYEWLRKKVPPVIGAGVATAICLIVPLIMGAENWDDHDRSNRYTTRDFALNYLESCAPNAIIFTQGDNDTYPLWYAQEVENIRRDVRVVNLSLLGVDWYINQLRYPINDAPVVNLSFSADQIRGSTRDMIRFHDNQRVPQDQYFELDRIIAFMSSEDRDRQLTLTTGETSNYLPTKKLKISVKKDQVASMNMVPENVHDMVVDEMFWELPKNNLLKNDLIVLDIIANNIWNRPIYFAVSVSPDTHLGLSKYFQLEGLAYRVVPVEAQPTQEGVGRVAADIMYNNMMNEFRFGNIEVDGVYLDENILRMVMNLRSNMGRLAGTLIAEGDKERAKQVLDKALEVTPPHKVPYNYFMYMYPMYYYRLGDREKAAELLRALTHVYEQEYRYYTHLGRPYADQAQRAASIMQGLVNMAETNQDEELRAELSDRLSRLN